MPKKIPSIKQIEAILYLILKLGLNTRFSANERHIVALDYLSKKGSERIHIAISPDGWTNSYYKDGEVSFSMKGYYRKVPGMIREIYKRIGLSNA